MRQPLYYRYAQRTITCECPACGCPYNNGMRYSFVYIHEQKKIIYYDVPKCASTAIRKELFKGRDLFSLVNPKRSLDEYLKFAFVRNPWARLVSNWKMFTTQPQRVKQLRAMTDKDLSDFRDFVYFADENRNHHWQPQVMFVPEKLDFLGRIETFATDFSRLCALIGEQPRTLPKLNATDHRSYQKYYTRDLVDVVRGMYADDIARFGYKFAAPTRFLASLGALLLVGT